MAMELPQNRLATTDSSGKRVYLYPASVKGRYLSRKQWIHSLLMLLFLLLPWIHLNGRQLLLLDIGRREFFFFGLHFRAHDAPLILFLFVGFAFLIGLVSAIWGRLWCGWACPQTVFTETIFRRIESWIEGNHRERKALDEGPFTAEKIRKKTLKWAAFSAVSLILTHSFLAYFVGSYDLLRMISSSPLENWSSFLVILGTTLVILFDFGWFREQFCVIMCPYGRFQSVMLDSQSLVVGYDTKRGEPRRGTGIPQGDCVNCLRCVQVCPTGIDIRRGLQMECITCTACIDACNEVMRKIKKPLGLIRYTTLAELLGQPRRVNLRALGFGLLFSTSMAAMWLTLSQKDYLDITILRAAGAPYEILKANGTETVLNHFRLDLSNQTGAKSTLQFSISEGFKANKIELIFPQNPLNLDDSENKRVDFFVRFPKALLEKGAKTLPLSVRSGDRDRTLEVSLVGPDA